MLAAGSADPQAAKWHVPAREQEKRQERDARCSIGRNLSYPEQWAGGPA